MAGEFHGGSGGGGAGGGGYVAGLPATPLVPPTAAGIRSLRIELPQTGQPFLFTKVLNVRDEPLSIRAHIMTMHTFQTIQMAWQSAAFLLGLVVWFWQWRRMNRSHLLPEHSPTTSASSLASPTGGEGRGEEASLSQDQIPSPQPSPRLGGEREPGKLSASGTFILTVALALIIGSVCSLLIQWRALHDALIVGFPVVVVAVIAWLVWKYWPRGRRPEIDRRTADAQIACAAPWESRRWSPRWSCCSR